MDAPSQNEVLEALRLVMERTDSPEDAFTTKELAKELKIGIQATRLLLQCLDTQGELECLDVKRRSINGHYQWVPAYRLRPRAP